MSFGNVNGPNVANPLSQIPIGPEYNTVLGDFPIATGLPQVLGVLDPRDAAGEAQRAEAVKSYYATRQQVANQLGLKDGTPEYTQFLLNYQQDQCIGL